MTDPGAPPPRDPDLPPGDPFIPPAEPVLPPPDVASMPPQPMPPPPVAATGAGAPADLGTRFLARLIDHLILGAVSAIIIVPLIIGAMFTANVGVGNGFGFGFGGFSVGTLVAAILTAIVVIGYFTLMEARNGQTIGKMAMSIRTQGADGTPPTTEQAFKRNAWYALAIIPFLGGLAQLAVAIYIAVTINNSASRIGWHDTFAGTQVVKTK